MAGRAGIQAALILYSAFSLVPILFTVFASLRSDSSFFGSPFSLAGGIALSNYSQAWAQGDLAVGLGNSVIVTVVGVATSTVLGAWAAYAVVRLRPRLRRWMQVLFVGGLVIPGPVIVIPIFLLMHEFGLTGNISSIAIPYMALCLPLSFLIFVNFLRTIPFELTEAGQLDGCGYGQIFWKIEFPILRPAIATVVILNAVFVWNDFLLPLVLGTTNSTHTLPVAIVSFFGVYSTSWGLVFAGVIMASIPVIVLYIFFNRHFVEGITTGAVK
jgi:raffinose/stachyose/melibiose transport system permease protein